MHNIIHFVCISFQMKLIILNFKIHTPLTLNTTNQWYNNIVKVVINTNSLLYI
jgi:hypothetical protein